MRSSLTTGLVAVLLACGVVFAGWQPANSAASPAAPAAPAAIAAVADALIPVRVSTRVELLSIVFQLAGSPEYNQMNAQSPYSQRAQEYFRGFAGHEVVKLAREYRKNNGISSADYNRTLPE